MIIIASIALLSLIQVRSFILHVSTFDVLSDTIFGISSSLSSLSSCPRFDPLHRQPHEYTQVNTPSATFQKPKILPFWVW